jgi:hypothetical protein
MQTRTHKIHHGLDLGEATTFPLIVFYVLGHGTSTQMSFCPRTLKWESQISQIETFVNLEAYNIVCKPLIELMSKAKL